MCIGRHALINAEAPRRAWRNADGRCDPCTHAVRREYHVPYSVSEAICAAVAMERGKRPHRIVVDPQRRRIEDLNALRAKLQRDSFKRLGIDYLIDTRIE